MAATAYNKSIRQALNKQGIDNSQIGYKNGYVTVNGNNFMKADKNYNGAAFTNQQNFTNAWNAYSRASQPKVPTATPTTTTPRVPTAPAGSVPIRSGLQSAGYNPSSIGYNKTNNTVTLNNQPFMVPSANVQGTTYGNQQTFNNALSNYRIGDLTNRIVNNTNLPTNQYTSQIDDTIRQLMDFAKNQQQIDPYSTHQYASYKAQADRRANEGIRSAQEAMGSSGFGRSLALGERAQDVQNQETAYLETQVIPQIIAAEQARQQQQYDNLFSVLNPLMSQQGYADTRAQNELQNVYNALGAVQQEQQRGYDNARADAALTGNYMTPEAQQAINALLGLKQQAETKGITKDQRTALSKQADVIRNELSMMGIDASQFGANVNYNTASKVNPGRTLQGQQLDLQKKQSNMDAAGMVSNQTGRVIRPQDDWMGLYRQAQNPNTPLTMDAQQQAFNNKQLLEEFAYRKARDTIADTQWQAQFDENNRQFGLGYAMDQLRRQDDQAYRNAQIAMGQDDNARLWVQMEYEMANQPNGSSGGLTANQVLQSMRGLYTDPVYETDEAGIKTKTGSQITKDPTKREQMFLNVVDSGLSDKETNQILQSLGMTKSEIDGLMKKYGGSSGN
ncbi:hypothetical protein [Paenibacillus sp. DMB20]|uniref:hypothetical protein n=1 Tax=Paenibacillus sp. DMB20 TaxID=1642570 RepID=UPI00062778A2|nr:hypothetical protein [Paenibacillus sp. DMB20]KKO51162.1 hypothetical protein XI25_29695 [Paenibacillus sp. DMB20]